MHKYLRSIGFTAYKRNKEFKEIIKKVSRFADSKKYVSGEDEIIWAEYRKEFAPGMGIALCGEYTEENEFELEYYFPYFNSDMISSSENISIEQHFDMDSFSGVCEDNRIGVSLIFYLQNRMDYLHEYMCGNMPAKNTSVSLTGLSTEGMIVLPLSKDEEQVRKTKSKTMKRNKLIAKAKAGDEEAMESLTLDDMDTYNIVSKQIFKSDVFTLVDTYFMPYGVECENYSIMGEIEDSRLIRNSLTNEEIYIISICCNDLYLNVCINKKDLLGEPAPKRRFKGTIWLQGNINF